MKGVEWNQTLYNCFTNETWFWDTNRTDVYRFLYTGLCMMTYSPYPIYYRTKVNIILNTSIGKQSMYRSQVCLLVCLLGEISLFGRLVIPNKAFGIANIMLYSELRTLCSIRNNESLCSIWNSEPSELRTLVNSK